MYQAPSLTSARSRAQAARKLTHTARVAGCMPGAAIMPTVHASHTRPSPDSSNRRHRARGTAVPRRYSAFDRRVSRACAGGRGHSSQHCILNQGVGQAPMTAVASGSCSLRRAHLQRVQSTQTLLPCTPLLGRGAHCGYTAGHAFDFVPWPPLCRSWWMATGSDRWPAQRARAWEKWISRRISGRRLSCCQFAPP